MHNASNFAEHCLALLKNDVPHVTGVTALTKTFNSQDKTGTCGAPKLGHVQKHLSRANVTTCTNKIELKQQPTNPVTCGTSGTSIFAGGTTAGSATKAPAEWHAILAELKRAEPAEWLSADRWNDLLVDSEIFLSEWGIAAYLLGWIALDLFGVHPLAPAARFDAMGLLMLIRGGHIVALTERSATFRRRSGALLTFQRSDEPSRVLISAQRSSGSNHTGER